VESVPGTFAHGWAVRLFAGSRADYFVREGAGLAKPPYGRPATFVTLLRGAGTFLRCKICERKEMRR
jgi:hypothetical protein